MEIGVVEFAAMINVFNVDTADTIKVAKYAKYGYGQKYVRLEKNKNIDETLNAALKQQYSGIVFKHHNSHFSVAINQAYILQISKELASTLCFSTTLLRGAVVSKRRGSRTFTKKYRSEYLHFYKSTPERRVYRISRGYYKSSEHIREAFKTAGISISNDGNIPLSGIDRILIKPKLAQLLKRVLLPNYFILHCNQIENENVGDSQTHVLRIIPKTLKSATYKNIQYKRMHNIRELHSINLALYDDHNQIVQFDGSFAITLHIRQHASNPLL